MPESKWKKNKSETALSIGATRNATQRRGRRHLDVQMVEQMVGRDHDIDRRQNFS